jgi:hypothetical protein
VSGLRALMVWQREPDAPAGSGDDGGAVGHRERSFVSGTTRRGIQLRVAGPGTRAERGGETRLRAAAGTAITPGPGSRNYDMISIQVRAEGKPGAQLALGNLARRVPGSSATRSTADGLL